MELPFVIFMILTDLAALCLSPEQARSHAFLFCRFAKTNGHEIVYNMAFYD